MTKTGKTVLSKGFKYIVSLVVFWLVVKALFVVMNGAFFALGLIGLVMVGLFFGIFIIREALWFASRFKDGDENITE